MTLKRRCNWGVGLSAMLIVHGLAIAITIAPLLLLLRHIVCARVWVFVEKYLRVEVRVVNNANSIRNASLEYNFKSMVICKLINIEFREKIQRLRVLCTPWCSLFSVDR